MSNAPTTSLPPGQANKLAVLLDALDGVAFSDGERASLAGRGRGAHRNEGGILGKAAAFFVQESR